MINKDLIIRNFRKKFGLTQEEFANLLNISRRTVQLWESGSAIPESKRNFIEVLFNLSNINEVNKAIERINNEFSTSFVVKSDKLLDALTKEHNKNDNNQKRYNVNQEILNAKEVNKQRGVPALPIKVQGGFSLHYNDPVYWSQLDRIYIPGLPYDGDDYLWAEMEGDSMEYIDERTGQLAGIQDRVWCIYQKVPQEFWRTGLRKFYVHLVITRTGLFTVKRILQDNPDEIVLSPDNPLYNQERIHLSEVLAIYIFKRKLDWNAPPPRQIKINV